MKTMTIRKTIDVDVEVTVEEMARGFALLGDDEQARFFDFVAKAMDEWGAGKSCMQRLHIARHFFDCECVSDTAGPDWVEGLAEHVRVVREERR